MLYLTYWEVDWLDTILSNLVMDTDRAIKSRKTPREDLRELRAQRDQVGYILKKLRVERDRIAVQLGRPPSKMSPRKKPHIHRR